MNSTWVKVAHSSLGRLLLAGVLVLLAGTRALAAEDPMPRPPELERDVQFWIRVYTEVDTNGGFLHDEHNLAVVYEKLHFAPNTPPRERERIVEQGRARYAAALRRIAAANGAPLSEEDQRIADMWGSEGTPARLLEATDEIRFQLGQSDRFRAGLIRSGAWETHIAETLANLGLPAELSVLPHVESSFNPAAYSKVGAAGLWQFMRTTGRRYMRIDSAVDDRLDPFRSTEAAAQLLAYNYRLLGTWPLALTAYNHGAEGMRRAKESLGTDDIVKIVRNYKGRTFGFASRNFYVSFLAALEIDRNPEKYFGPIERSGDARFQEVTVPGYVQMATLERALKIDRQKLRELNPALLRSVWEGQRRVPKAYHLRLPVDGNRWTTELLAARLSPNDFFAAQSEPRRYRVRRGDTVASVADQFGVTPETLARSNRMRTSGKLKVGHLISVPESTAGTSAASAMLVATTAPGRTSEEAASGVPMAGTAVPGTNLPGRERLTGAVGPPDSSPVPVVASGAVPVEEAARESAEEAKAVAKAEAPAEQSQPVSAAQAEELSPALGPAAETQQSADPTDYTVAKDNTVRVAAAETLGHYAEWLNVSAARLRQLNQMSFAKPVLIGHKIKLDFARVSREAFEAKRREYHTELQATYFAEHRIIGTEVYIVRRGDALWTVTQRFAQLPLWLLQQYNPDVDLADLRPGTQIVMPRVENVVAGPG
jgi:membrane-bound lytic murein transglycosylase D